MFGDPLALDIDEPSLSEEEFRFVILGNSDRRRLLTVAYAEPETDMIRIHCTASNAARTPNVERTLSRLPIVDSESISHCD